MLIVVVGTPSPIASWTLHVVRIALQAILGDHRLLTSQTLETFRLDRRSSASDCTLLYTMMPSLGLARLLVRAKAPIIAAIDDPADVVSFQMAAGHMPVHLAVREYMKSAATLHLFASAPSSIRFTSLAYDKPFRTFLTELVYSCRFEIDPALLEEVVAAVIGEHPSGNAASVGDLMLRDIPGTDRTETFSALDVRSKALIEEIGRQYETMLTGGDFSTVECPLALYIADKGRLYDPDNPWLSMVGPARCILWGPYIHLPRGKWLAHVKIAIRGNVSGNALQIRILRELLECMTSEAKLENVGAFECELEFEIDDPLDRLEVTFTLKEGAIEGDFRVLALTFVKIAEATK